MKKLIRLGLCLGVLTAALTCSALAATPDYTTDSAGTVDYAGGKYTASYTGATSGNQYVILVVKGSADDYSISENTIMYIDQKATESGTISFDFIPKSTPDCVVLLGGEFSDGQSPKVLGTLIGQGVTVSGKVSLGAARLPGKHDGIMVSLTENTTGTVYTATSLGDGSFTIDGVQAGIYTIQFSMDGFLKYTNSNVEIEESTVLDLVSLKGGDINASGTIDGTDLSVLLGDFGSTVGDTASSEYSDINGSGTVEGTDLSVMLSNFGEGNIVIP